MTTKTSSSKAAKPFIGSMAHMHQGHAVNVSPATTILYMALLGKDIVVASVNTYKDRTALDIRRFYLSDSGQYEATAKGIRIPMADAPVMAAALHTAAQHGAFTEEGTA